MANDITSALITGGLGATIGSVATTLIQVYSKKGETRAQAANIISGYQSQWIDKLQRENQNVREVLVSVTDILDELIDTDLPDRPDLKAKLRDINKRLKLVI